jgi:hypothetical protein
MTWLFVLITNVATSTRPESQPVWDDRRSFMSTSHSDVLAVVAVFTVVIARRACVSDKKVLTLRHLRASGREVRPTLLSAQSSTAAG